MVLISRCANVLPLLQPARLASRRRLPRLILNYWCRSTAGRHPWWRSVVRPGALVLSDIGPALSAVPVLITQHMPPTFTEMLAENLGKTCGRRTKEAKHGEKPEAGVIYVAPGGKHLIVKRTTDGVVMELEDRPPVNFTKPSVDVMFESIAAVYGVSVLSVMLTGMGHDGAAGAVLLRDAGGNVIAQDEATSVVWGMQGATAHTGKCSVVLPLGEIGSRVARLVQGVTS